MSRTTETPRRVRPAGIAAPADRRFHRSGLRPEQRRVGRTILRSAKWVAGMAVVVAGGFWLTDVVLHARMLTVQHVRVLIFLELLQQPLDLQRRFVQFGALEQHPHQLETQIAVGGTQLAARRSVSGKPLVQRRFKITKLDEQLAQFGAGRR